MGNCAGCTGPQRRRFQVQRIEQNSPIKSRLSNGKKYYPNNSQVQQYSYNNGRDKINENQMFVNTFSLGFSKTNSATQLGMSYTNGNNGNNNINNYSNNNNNNTNTYGNNIINPNDNQNFTYNILNQVAKTHIKLYPDNPQLKRDSITKLQKSYVNINNQNDYNQLGSSSHKSINNNNNNIMTNSDNNFNNINNNNSNFNNNLNTLSANPLVRSIHSQSKRILQQSYSNQKTPLKLQSVYNTNEFKTQQTLQRQVQYQSPLSSIAISRYDQTTNKMNKNYQNQKIQNASSELPFKKYSKYHKNLTVIEELLQQDHKTPLEIKKQRKKWRRCYI